MKNHIVLFCLFTMVLLIGCNRPSPSTPITNMDIDDLIYAWTDSTIKKLDLDLGIDSICDNELDGNMNKHFCSWEQCFKEPLRHRMSNLKIPLMLMLNIDEKVEVEEVYGPFKSYVSFATSHYFLEMMILHDTIVDCQLSQTAQNSFYSGNIEYFRDTSWSSLNYLWIVSTIYRSDYSITQNLIHVNTVPTIDCPIDSIPSLSRTAVLI